jgi:hypothetical protein
MSRVALQRDVGSGNVETIAPAYNRTTMNPLPFQDANLSRAATCIGRACAWWEPSPWNIMCYFPIIGFWWPRCGRCGGGR